MEDKRKDMKIERKHERRTKGISKMIDEGGLGADKYYKIKKDTSTEEEIDKESKDSSS